MAQIRVYTKEQILNTFPNKEIEILNKERIENIKFIGSVAFVLYSGKHWLKCEATREGNWNILSSKKCFSIDKKQQVILVPKNCKLKRYVAN